MVTVWRKVKKLTCLLLLSVLVFSDELQADLKYLSSFDTGGGASNVQVEGSTAYLANGSTGLWIVDVSDLQKPTLVARYDTPGIASGVHVIGSVAYVADGDSGIVVLDISDPFSIEHVGSYQTEHSAHNIYIAGSIAFTIDIDSYLEVFDVSNPSDIRFLDGEFVRARQVQVIGSTAYVAAFTALYVYDISDPSDLRRLGTYRPRAGDVQGVQVDGSYAYVTNFSVGLEVVDVSDPTAMSSVSSVVLPTGARSARISDGTAYVAGGGFHAIDVSDPTQPLLVGEYGASPWSFDMVESTAFFADFDGLEIVDISNPSNMAHVGQLETRGFCENVFVSREGIAYAANGPLGLWVGDVTDPTDPKFVNWYETVGDARGAYVSGSIGYLADGDGGLHVLDVSDVSNIKLLDTIGFGSVSYVQATVSTLYAAVGSSLAAIDASDPTDIARIGSYNSSSRDIKRFSILQDTAYLAAWTNIDIVDVSNPRAMRAISIYETDKLILEVDVVDNRLYAANHDNGLLILDISDTSNPTLIGSYDIRDGAHGVSVIGNLAFVAQDSRGLLVLDVSDPTNVVAIDSYDTPGQAWGLVVDEGVAYVASISSVEIVDVSSLLA